MNRGETTINTAGNTLISTKIQKGATGNVALQLSVGADGKVTNVRVASSQLTDMNTASMDAARRWTFKPVNVSGRAVPFWVRLIFQYVSQ